MDPFMDLHVVLKPEHLAADITLIGLLTSVRDRMATKLTGVVEDDVAVGIRTGVGLGRWVMLDTHMALIARVIEEGLITLLADRVVDVIGLFDGVVLGLILINELCLTLWLRTFLIRPLGFALGHWSRCNRAFLRVLVDLFLPLREELLRRLDELC